MTPPRRDITPPLHRLISVVQDGAHKDLELTITVTRNHALIAIRKKDRQLVSDLSGDPRQGSWGTIDALAENMIDSLAARAVEKPVAIDHGGR